MVVPFSMASIYERRVDSADCTARRVHDVSDDRHRRRCDDAGVAGILGNRSDREIVVGNPVEPPPNTAAGDPHQAVAESKTRDSMRLETANPPRDRRTDPIRRSVTPQTKIDHDTLPGGRISLPATKHAWQRDCVLLMIRISRRGNSLFQPVIDDWTSCMTSTLRQTRVTM